ncbi:hypothetical protein D3C72_2051630 [compost metagenome]
MFVVSIGHGDHQRVCLLLGRRRVPVTVLPHHDHKPLLPRRALFERPTRGLHRTVISQLGGNVAVAGPRLLEYIRLGLLLLTKVFLHFI